MSFADELRNAPARKKKDEEEQRKRIEQQRKRDWDQFIDLWYGFIKKRCIQQAESESNSCSLTLSYFVKYDLEKNLKNQNEEEWYQRIRPRFEYQLNPKSEYITVCVSEEDVSRLIDCLESKFREDGLKADIKKKELQKYKIDFVWVERSKGERITNGIFNLVFNECLDESEGSYKEKRVKDGFRYDVDITVSW